MAFVLEQTSEQIKNSISVHSHAEIRTVRLTRTRLESYNSDTQWKIPLILSFAYASPESSFSGGVLRVGIEFTMNVIDSATPAATVIELTATFDVFYQIQEDFEPTQEQVEAFSTGNAVYNCWPYFREYAQSTAMRASVPMPIVPFLKVQVAPPVAASQESPLQ